MGRRTARGACADGEGDLCESVPAAQHSGRRANALVPVCQWRGDLRAVAWRCGGAARSSQLASTGHSRRRYTARAELFH